MRDLDRLLSTQKPQPVKQAWFVGLSLGAIVILSGCGSVASGQSVDPALPAASAPSPTHASTMRLASIVATHQPALARGATELEACAKEDPAQRACVTDATTQIIMANNLIQDLEAAGSPDPEVEALVAKSIFAAKQILITCPKVGSKDDIKAYGLLSYACGLASRTLVDDLNGWRPYGG